MLSPATTHLSWHRERERGLQQGALAQPLAPRYVPPPPWSKHSHLDTFLRVFNSSYLFNPEMKTHFIPTHRAQACKIPTAQ